MDIFAIEYAVRLLFLFTLGAVLGSLLNVCIYRLPKTEQFWVALRSLVSPPSHCPRCQNRIAWYDNVPIFGWLKLGGRCRNCKARISPRYALVELLTGLLFVVLYWYEVPPPWKGGFDASSVFHQYGPQGSYTSWWFSPVAVQHWRYAYHLVLVLALIVATFIDFDHWIIPDSVTLPAMTVGVLGGWLLGEVYLVPVWFQNPRAMTFVDVYRILNDGQPPGDFLPQWLSLWLNFKGLPAWISAHPHLHGLLVSLAGIIVGGGVVWAVRIVGFWVLKREAMGFGDVILLAMIGSFVGWQASLVVFFMAPLCALAVVAVAWLVRRDREIPYGPYLSLATIVSLLTWKHIWPPLETHIFALGPFLPVAGGLMIVSLATLLFISRAVQRMLGIEFVPEEEQEQWGSGDQLAYLAGEFTDPQQGQWPISTWPGTLSSRGQSQEHEWRNAGSAGDWQSHWQRRSNS